MSLSNIIVTEGQGGTARVITTNDNQSGFIFYQASLTKPSVWSGATSINVTSLEEAVQNGITSSSYPVPYYHLSEFYRINPSGSLQVAFYGYTGGTQSFNEVTQLQTDADNTLSQIAIYTTANFSSSMVSQLNSVVATLKTNDAPAIALLSANITASTLTTLPDLSASNCPLVSVVIGQDGGGSGKALYTSVGKSISCLGATLGAVGKSQVHQSIAWKGQFNMSGTDLDTLAFANGTAYKSLSRTQLGQLNDKNYIFLLKDVGLNGSFFNSSFSSVSSSSDYYSVERNRTINKSRRLLRTALLPELNSPLYLDASGKLSQETIAKFTALCENALQSMKIAGELSNYSIVIDANQNVLSNDSLNISANLQPVGVARFINLTIGFVVSIA